MSAIRFRYDESDLPNQFDAREKWTNLNSDVLDQGWCGASWAFSTASVASDRFVIDSKGPSINDVISFFFLFDPSTLIWLVPYCPKNCCSVKIGCSLTETV